MADSSNGVLPKEIEACEEALRLAMQGDDVQRLAELLADDLVFVDPSGQVADKTGDLDAHRTGAIRMHQIELKDVQARQAGDAWITVTLAELAGTFHDAPFAGSYRYVRVWRHRGALWQVVAGSVTAVTG